ncbi:MAG: Hsp70 family protein [Pseudomonadales bacterium]|nr:Hsp70 family protein [Pseudomonadales bacterium]
MIGVGIDFGTSNSAAAWYDGKQVRLVRLEDEADIMPTATHLNTEFETKTGEAAVRQYIEENRDRVVELTPEVIGKGNLLVDEGDPDEIDAPPEVATLNVYGQANVDRGMPGRLFRGVKRLLGNPDVKRLMVFDKPFRLVALITPVLLRIRRTIETHIPEKLGDVHFGHPVKFEGHGDFRNDLGFDRLREATTYAGYREISFYPEPIAATLSYLHDEDSPDRGRVLTVDFGGGTLDLCIIEYEGIDFRVLSTAGRSLGGDHIDQLIFRELLFPLLGKGENFVRIRDGQRIESEFPFNEYADRLLNWAVTYTLNQNYYKSKLAERIAQGDEGAEKFQRLQDLITHNYSYLVFQAIKNAKARLSEVEETVIDIPELDISIPFTRDHFEGIMADALEEIDAVIEELLNSAGCQLSDIDIVIRTGGSSQIAAVRRMLEQKFPGKVTEHDPFTSVAAGLAIASYHGYQFHS